MAKPRLFEAVSPVKVGERFYKPGEVFEETFDRNWDRMIGFGAVRLCESEAPPVPAPETVEPEEAVDLGSMTKLGLKRHAESIGIDLSSIAGSGSGGAVLKNDLIAAIEGA